MAFTTKFPLLILVLLLLLFVVITPASVCTTRHGCFFSKAAATTVHNRKVIYYELEKQKVGSKAKGGVTANSKNENVGVEWDLRRVPSGPDPLHHNGGSPKKPRTP